MTQCEDVSHWAQTLNICSACPLEQQAVAHLCYSKYFLFLDPFDPLQYSRFVSCRCAGGDKDKRPLMCAVSKGGTSTHTHTVDRQGVVKWSVFDFMIYHRIA